MSDVDSHRRSVAAPRLVSTTTADSYRLWTRVWDDNAEPIAQVVLLHGIVSHGGWYLRTGRFLAEAGMEVHLPDRRGSGLHQIRSGDVDRWEQWPTDVEGYLETLCPDKPVVLLGISWGAKLAMAIARRQRVALAGLGLICPGLFARQSPGAIKRTLLRVLGHGPLGGVRVAVPLGDPALFTDDPQWQQYVRTDPLTLRRITLRFAREDQRLTELATRPDPPLHVPTLLMLAGRDRIAKNEPTRALIQTVTENRSSIYEYPEAAHTLEFDPGAESYLNDLRTWILDFSLSAKR